MKKIILALLFLGTLISAQTHRFVYEFQFKEDSTSSSTRKEPMVLDINPSETKFYPYAYVETDSLNKKNPDNHNLMWDDLPSVVRKKDAYQHKNYFNVNHLFVIESRDEMTWNLSSETKMSGNYILQKATTKFGGRSWTAWFNKETAISEGPYKFRGLPGLIFEIEDTAKNFSFKLLKSYRLIETYSTREIIENWGGQTAIPLTQKKYDKLLLDNFNDPLREFREHYKKNTDPQAKFMFNNIEVKSADQFHDLSRMAQERARKNNNPIEIDKAVHYPEK
ncbi:GLPGLI family protein [Chryseobacterium sp. Leaf394]|uniref:GLPGLI family protein n=1 Tax=Chryseobacterium sp. Leaf394 TaxID=1736361 RepID=UPI0006FE5713|nr:GLPGLI family protein [Chryseobacterium sp. Leaf394]KQS95157.1 hypothetical protein ASG21_17075 [Chryseobacterium sp. Leaf394]